MTLASVSANLDGGQHPATATLRRPLTFPDPGVACPSGESGSGTCLESPTPSGNALRATLSRWSAFAKTARMTARAARRDGSAAHGADLRLVVHRNLRHQHPCPAPLRPWPRRHVERRALHPWGDRRHRLE